MSSIERNLVLTLRTSGDSIIMKAGIDIPYTPAKTPGFQQMSGCVIRIGPEAAGEFKILGRDPLEALCNGLAAIDLYLKGLSKSGELRWEDGSQYQASEEPLGSDAMIALAELVRSTPEDIHRG